MTYMFDNKQYVAVAAGSNIIAFGLAVASRLQADVRLKPDATVTGRTAPSTSSRRPARGRSPDPNRCRQRVRALSVGAEESLAVAGLPKQIHDRLDVGRVLEAERVAELVQRREVHDDAALERRAARIGGYRHFRPDDEAVCRSTRGAVTP